MARPTSQLKQQTLSPRTRTIFGDDPARIQHTLDAFARIIQNSTNEINIRFIKEEWNFLGALISEYNVLLFHTVVPLQVTLEHVIQDKITNSSDPQTHELISALLPKLKELDPLHSLALAYTLTFYTEYHSHFKSNLEWWTLEARTAVKNSLEAGNKKVAAN